MNTQIFLTCQTIILGITGFVLLFLPEAIAPGMGSGDVPAYFWTQMAAAGTLAFAAQSWFGRNAILGGIYGRPIVYANFVFGIIASMSLLKMILGDAGSPQVIVLLCIYSQFAIGFGFLLMKGPQQPADRTT